MPVGDVSSIPQGSFGSERGNIRGTYDINTLFRSAVRVKSPLFQQEDYNEKASFRPPPRRFERL